MRARFPVAVPTSLLLGLGLAAPGPAGATQSHLVIVVGLGGEPKYTEAFHDLAVTMLGAAEKTMGVPPGNLAYLGEKPAWPGLSAYSG
ncbi:MAG TPA: hypothetical protein VMR21_05000, partial [Vicinamibacteria bacterium]|nr:hypothetical protein [Vicinamibacteria bacterium]